MWVSPDSQADANAQSERLSVLSGTQTSNTTPYLAFPPTIDFELFRTLPSLNDPERLGIAVLRFLEAYQAYRSEHDDPFDNDERLRAAIATATPLCRLSMGETAAWSWAKRLSLLSTEVSMQWSETFQSTMGALLGLYYDQPQHREALFLLITQISACVGPEIRSDDREYRVARSFILGTVWTWSALTLLEWRGGVKGLSNDWERSLSGIGRSWQWTSARIRQAAEAVRTTGVPNPSKAGSAISRIVPSLQQTLTIGAARAREHTVDTALEILDRAHKSPELALEKLSEARERFRSSWKNRAEVSKKALRGWSRFFARMGISAATGGVVSAIWGLNTQTVPDKFDPIEALEVFQAFAIADLEEQAYSLLKRLSQEVRPSTLAALRARALAYPQAYEQWLSTLQREWTALELQLAHFENTAGYFKGNVPFLARHSTRETKLLLPLAPSTLEQVTQMKDFKKLLANLEAELRAQAPGREDESFHVSLKTVKHHLDGSFKILKQLPQLTP